LSSKTAVPGKLAEGPEMTLIGERQDKLAKDRR
jgi:hypothetical protein